MSFAAPESGYDKTHNFLLEKIAFGLFNFQRALFSEKSKLFDYNKIKEKVNYMIRLFLYIPIHPSKLTILYGFRA